MSRYSRSALLSFAVAATLGQVPASVSAQQLEGAYERMIARRYLLPGQGERFIVLVAGISLVAVALGVAALIAVMSVMNGFRAELFDRFQGLNGHAVAQGYGGRLPDWRRVIAR